MISMLRALMENVDKIQEQVDNLSREIEILKKKKCLVLKALTIEKCL